MKIVERIKSLFRRESPTSEELAARAEAESMRAELRQTKAVLQNQIEGRQGGTSF